LFFVAVGMLLDLSAVAERPGFVIGMAAALIFVKALVLFGLAKLFRMETRKAWRTGLLLSQGGEFGFVLFTAAQDAVLITPEAASLFGAIVTVSMASTPFLMMFNRWNERRASLGDGDGLDGPEQSEESRAIVIGYGRFGQTVAQMLMAKGVSLTLIDSKPSQIERSGGFGMKVYYGDGTRLDLLRSAGAGDAKALLFCIDGNSLNPKKLEPILEAFPQAAIYVRVFDRIQLMALDGVDVAGTYREVFETAVLMGRQALSRFGVSEEEAERVEAEFRRRDSERLESQSRSGDLHATKHLMFRPDQALPDEEGQPAG
jgi:glutathione-regulated potassium-efflux system protein KefB